MLFALNQLHIVPVTKASGDIVVSGDQVVIIEETTYIHTGNIMIKDNGTLVIRNSRLQVQYAGKENVTVIDHGRLILQNGIIESAYKGGEIPNPGLDMYLGNYANLTATQNSNFNGRWNLKLSGQSTIKFERSAMGREQVTITGSCKSISISNSGINVEAFTLSYVSNFSISNSGLGWYTEYGAYPYAENPRMSISGDSSSTFSAVDSRLCSMWLPPRTPLEFHGSIRSYLHNVTTNPPSSLSKTSISVFENAVLRKYWWLTVHVADSRGVPVVGANVTVSHFLNGTVVSWHLTDKDGIARIDTLADIVTSSGDVFVGNYKVKAIYEGEETPQQAVTMDSNKEISLTTKLTSTVTHTLTPTPTSTPTITELPTTTTTVTKAEGTQIPAGYLAIVVIVVIAIISVALMSKRRGRVASTVVAPLAPVQGGPLQAKHCQYCGEELTADADFCLNCGKKIGPQTSITLPTPGAPVVAPAQKMGLSFKKRPWALWGLVGVFLLSVFLTMISGEAWTFFFWLIVLVVLYVMGLGMWGLMSKGVRALDRLSGDYELTKPPTGVRHCVACGNLVAANLPFCPHCGAKQS